MNLEHSNLKDHSRFILSRLRQEDSKAETMISWLQAGVMAFLGLVYMFNPSQTVNQEGVRPVTIVLLTLAPTVILRRILTRNRTVDKVLVHFFIFLDALFLCALILSSQIQFQNIQEGYLKASAFSYFFLLLSLRSLRYEKQFVIMSGIWSMLIWVGFGAYSVHSSAIAESLAPPGIAESILSVFVTQLDKIVAIVLVTFVLTIGVHRSRRLLISSVREVTSAHSLLTVKHKELIKAKGLADQAVKSRDSFLSIMGHELKTPLNAVIGFSELIKQEAEANNDSQYIEDADKVKLSGERLLFLIDRMLILSVEKEFSKTNTNKRAIKTSDLMNHLQRVSQNLNRSNIYFVFTNASSLDTVTTDIDILKKVAYEIMNNAIQFNDGRARIEISLEVTTRDEQRYLSILFTDNGWGIPKDDLDKIFDLSYQVEHYSTRTINGAGVGLSISKRLCEQIGVDLKVKSVLNKGSEFSLHIPLQKENRADLSIVKEAQKNKKSSSG